MRHKVQLQQPEANLLIQAFEDNNQDLALKIAASDTGFDLLQSALKQAHEKGRVESFLGFLLIGESAQSESFLAKIYKKNLERGLVLTNFIEILSKFMREGGSWQDRTILTDIFIPFINKGRGDIDLADFVQVLNRKIKTINPAEKICLNTILIDTLEQIHDKAPDTFSTFAYRMFEYDKETLCDLMESDFNASNDKLFGLFNDQIQPYIKSQKININALNSQAIPNPNPARTPQQKLSKLSEIKSQHDQSKYPSLLVAYVNENLESFAEIIKSQDGGEALISAANFLQNYPDDLRKFVEYLSKTRLLAGIFEYGTKSKGLAGGACFAWVKSINDLKACGAEFTERGAKLEKLFDNFIVQIVKDRKNLSLEMLCGMMIDKVKNGDQENEDMVKVFSEFIVKLLESEIASNDEIEPILERLDTKLFPKLLSQLLVKNLDTNPDLAAFIIKKAAAESPLNEYFAIDLPKRKISIMDLYSAQGSVENIKFLVAQGFDLEKQNLTFAYKAGNEEVFKFLLQNGLYGQLNDKEKLVIKKDAKANHKKMAQLLDDHEKNEIKAAEERKGAEKVAKKRIKEQRDRQIKNQEEENQRIAIQNLESLLKDQGFVINQQDNQVTIFSGEVLCYSHSVAEFQSKTLQEIVQMAIKSRDFDASEMERMKKQCDKIDCLIEKLQTQITAFRGRNRLAREEREQRDSASEIISCLEDIVKKSGVNYDRKTLKAIDDLFVKSKTPVLDQDLERFKKTQELKQKLKQDELEKQQIAEEQERQRQRELKILQQTQIENTINIFYNNLSCELNKGNISPEAQKDFGSFLLDENCGINASNIGLHKKRITEIFVKAHEVFGDDFLKKMDDFLEILLVAKTQFDKIAQKKGFLDFVETELKLRDDERGEFLQDLPKNIEDFMNDYDDEELEVVKPKVNFSQIDLPELVFLANSLDDLPETFQENPASQISNSPRRSFSPNRTPDPNRLNPNAPIFVPNGSGQCK